MASKSAELTALVAVTVGQGIALMCARARGLVAGGAKLRAVGHGPATVGQLRNITISSQLFEVQRACVMLLPRLPPAAAEVRPRLSAACSPTLARVLGVSPHFSCKSPRRTCQPRSKHSSECAARIPCSCTHVAG